MNVTLNLMFPGATCNLTISKRRNRPGDHKVCWGIDIGKKRGYKAQAVSYTRSAVRDETQYKATL